MRTQRSSRLVGKVRRLLSNSPGLDRHELDRLHRRLEAELNKRDNWTPKCPRCKEPLIAREAHKRFIEDDNYVQCTRGHVWELGEIDQR